MKSAKLQQAFSWLSLLFVILVIGVLVSIAIPNYCDYVPRQKVTEGLALAASAKAAVAENAANGMQFNNGWTPPNATINVSSKAVPTEADRKTNVYSGITINPTNGIITVTYTNKLQTGSPSILLIPVVGKSLPVLGKPPITGSINWECHSATAPANDDMQNLLGTLNPTLAPANCRS
jgi:type IV pilus assembly protein PilA